MRASELRKELQNKEKSIEDLARFIKTRTDNNPNYSLLLGAGCSVTSGVRPATKLVEQWRRELWDELTQGNHGEFETEKAIDYLRSNCGSWYNSAAEYSSLFERKYDLARQRRIFVESEVKEAKPSIGYAYLTNMVKSSFFNTIFTTNFDDLVNEAFYQFTDIRPIVCAHDSAITSITVTSKRPKLIKLHGDYLFDDIKSTMRETESLEENMRRKFVEFAKDFGLIVVGYGGSDRSVMDVLTYLLKRDEYYKSGIYWCVREQSEITEEVRKLLWRERAYYVVIDGFDEFFAELNERVDPGNPPLEPTLISNKSRSIVESFVKNESLLNSKSPVIVRDLSRLRRQTEKDNLFELIKKFDGNDSWKSRGESFSDGEMVKFLSLEKMIEKKKYSEVIEDVNRALSEPDLPKKTAVRLYQYLIEANEGRNDWAAAEAACDDLIALAANDPRHYLRKVDVVADYSKKIELCSYAEEIDPYYYPIYNKKVSVLNGKVGLVSDGRKRHLEHIRSAIELSLSRYPDMSNPAWTEWFDLVDNNTIDKGEREGALNKIIDAVSQQDARGTLVLRMRMKKLRPKAPKDAVDKLLEDIEDARRRAYREGAKKGLDLLAAEARGRFGRHEEMKMVLESMESDERFADDQMFLVLAADLWLKATGSLDKARNMLTHSLEIDNEHVGTVERLVDVYLWSGDVCAAEQLMEESRGAWGREKWIGTMREVFHEKGEYERERECIRKARVLLGEPSALLNSEIYSYLKEGDYVSARETGRKYLERENFNVELEAEIINYEIAKERSGGKLHKDRLGKVFESTSSILTKVAVKAVLREKGECLKYMEEAVMEDRRNAYQIRRWPAVDYLIGDKKCRELLMLGNDREADLGAADGGRETELNAREKR